MCGIIGMIGNTSVVPSILEGLRRLEYRGYDSAGIAVLNQGIMDRRRAAGKIAKPENELRKKPLDGNTGIGHTRWATHGVPNVVNAHPHVSGSVSVVHNGIIENHKQLREELVSFGFAMETETDTEVAAHLVKYYYDQGLTPEEIMRAIIDRLTGAYALVIMIADYPGMLMAARKSSPLAIGFGNNAMFVGSDALALAPMTRRISYLEDGDWTIMNRDSLTIYNHKNVQVDRPVSLTEVSGALIGKGKYRHFMDKEIHEQPEVIGYTLSAFYDPNSNYMKMPDVAFNPGVLPKLTIVAAGTSYYAGMIAKYWLEGLARLPVEVDIASEFRYRNSVLPEGGAALFISQSGESLDTLMALRHAREKEQHIISLINVGESTIARESDVVLKTLAGPEISVASTKAYTTQLSVLLCLSVDWAQKRNFLDKKKAFEIMDELSRLPTAMAEVLADKERWNACAHELAGARDIIYLGRGLNFPTALEGALKLKELSYIHAEGYAAGEMKHGPIALLDEGMPVVMVAPYDEWFDKTASNLKEALARGGRVVLLSDKEGIERLDDKPAWVFEMPKVDPLISPILYALPVQLLAYYIALEKGTDVDQPRNLAKSVTVE
ncbi:MAG: glutamine--fructose-6-phosphate transaminase (isomerizing) [Rhodospirillaceae bacterium]|nr:glutamine--fructose-6-phosphate transaminase (isomerizing) [Rhodospirillaceae bacterium]